MIRITQLKLHPDAGDTALEHLIRQTLHLGKGEEFTYEVMRRSVDARKKPELFYIYTVLVSLSDLHLQKKILKRRLRNVDSYEPVHYQFASGRQSKRDIDPDKILSDPARPVIIGTGPAGLFCALLLARQNLRPILIERGQRANMRARSVNSFWNGGRLDLNSNVQFGEGGAGTFSDGKLNTGVKDVQGRIRFILETFVEAGADPDILYSGKPHVGTDVLMKVVTAITDEICERGGEVYFETLMERISRSEDGTWKIDCRSKSAGQFALSARHLVLAIGHSSRDTFLMLKDAGIVMKAKAFAVGVRILHPQSLIDAAMYGENCSYQMPPSSYKLTHRLPDKRGVYSFCMCPGGYVVNASSENGMLAVNGMSNHDRASGNANSAIVVTVNPEEIAWHLNEKYKDPSVLRNALPADKPEAPSDVLIGMRFQRELERAAYAAGEGAIPVQRFEDYVNRTQDAPLRLPDYEPCIKGAWKMARIRSVFPDMIADAIEEGIFAWERQIKGFSGADALLCAAESRTSSPVRIERGEDLQAVGNPGLYPCGEGAGYAGGITSAAVDGLKAAEQILRCCYS